MSPDEADVLEYEIYTKRPNGRFPVTYRSLTGYCSDSGFLDEQGIAMLSGGDRPNAGTIEEARARAQAHFERRLAGLEVAPPEDLCAVTAVETDQDAAETAALPNDDLGIPEFLRRTA